MPKKAQKKAKTEPTTRLVLVPIRVEQEIVDVIDRIAKERQWSRSHVVAEHTRKMVRAYLDNA